MHPFIIIPAYNEASIIGRVISELKSYHYTVVVIDDNSTDNTASAAREHGAIVLSHCINLGQGAALQTGFEYARQCNADVMVTFDADGQHLASEISLLLNALEENNADIALGSRFLGEARNISATRRSVLQLIVHYTNFTTGLKLTDAHNGFRALRVATTRSINLKQGRMAHASELLQHIAANKLRYVEVPVTIIYTPYSIAKGQKLIQGIEILADLFLGRLKR